MNPLQSLVGFLGRALLSIIFIFSAVGKLFDWQSTLQYFSQALSDWLVINIGMDHFQAALEWGIDNAYFLLVIAVIFELLGGLMVFLGIWVRAGAILLLLFMIPATLVFHHFWQLEGPDRMQQMINFMKNVSICGGLLYLVAYGKGCVSQRQDDQTPKES